VSALTQLDLSMWRGSSLPLLEPLLQCTQPERLDLHGNAGFAAGEMRSFLTRLGSCCPALEYLSWIVDGLYAAAPTARPLQPAAYGLASADEDEEGEEEEEDLDERHAIARVCRRIHHTDQLHTLQLHARDVTNEALDSLSELCQLELLRIACCVDDTEHPVRALLQRLPELAVECHLPEW